jgi:hypothetical protein
MILVTFTMVTAFSVLAASNNVGLATYKIYKIYAEIHEDNADIHITVSNFSLMLNDCEASDHSNTSSPSHLAFPQPTAINGFRATVPEGWDDRPYILLLEGSNDNGSTWTLAGSSSLRWVEQGVRFLRRRTTGPAPVGGRLTVDFRPPWPYYAQFVLGPCLAALGWAATMLCGLQRDVASARHLAMAVLCLLALTFAVAAAGYLALGRPPLAIGPLVATAAAAAAAAALWRAEVPLAPADAILHPESCFDEY